jgi:hypothetical protein
MESTWFAIFPRYEAWDIYLDDDVINKHYCKNPKCHRLLTPCPNQNNLSSIKKIISDFVLLSSMNIYLCSDKFLSVITSYAKDDVFFKTINPNVNLLRIESTCEINDNLVDEAPPCPECKIALSRTYGRAFEGNKLRIFKKPDKETSLICRTKITMRDSPSATYDLYVKDVLANELKKFKCFAMLDCINYARSVN